MMEQKTGLTVLEGLTGLAHEIEVVICTMDKNNIALTNAEFNEALEDVSLTLATLFGGFTRFKAQGGWTLPGDILQVENNYVVQASISEQDFNDDNIGAVLNKVKLHKELYRQDAMSVRIDGKRYFI